MVDLTKKALQELAERKGKTYYLKCVECGETQSFNKDTLQSAPYLVLRSRKSHLLCTSCMRQLYRKHNSLFPIEDYLDKK